MKVERVRVGQLQEFVVAVASLLGAGVVVDFGQYGVVPPCVFARLAVVGQQDQQVVVVHHVVAVQIGMALARYVGKRQHAEDGRGQANTELRHVFGRKEAPNLDVSRACLTNACGDFKTAISTTQGSGRCP